MERELFNLKAEVSVAIRLLEARIQAIEEREAKRDKQLQEIVTLLRRLVSTQKKTVPLPIYQS
jgi:chaperonin cofactor prefoldin